MVVSDNSKFAICINDRAHKCGVDKFTIEIHEYSLMGVRERIPNVTKLSDQGLGKPAARKNQLRGAHP